MWESQFDADESKRVPQHIFTLLPRNYQRAMGSGNAIKPKRFFAKPISYEKQKVNFQNALDALLDDKKTASEKNHLLKALYRQNRISPR